MCKGKTMEQNYISKIKELEQERIIFLEINKHLNKKINKLERYPNIRKIKSATFYFSLPR